MAIIRFNDGTFKSIDSNKAIAIWKGLNGERPLTKEQAEFCSNVKRVYLNWREAPDSYVEQHFNHVLEQALQEWRVGVNNKPVSPGSEKGWEFAQKWGLWKNGRPSLLVTGKQLNLV